MHIVLMMIYHKIVLSTNLALENYHWDDSGVDIHLGQLLRNFYMAVEVRGLHEVDYTYRGMLT